MRKISLFALWLLACSSSAGAPGLDEEKGPSKQTPSPEGTGKPDPSKPGAEVDPGSTGGALVAASARPRLQWKRYATLESDLSSALELPPEMLCKEFGGASCVRDVHLVPLGGHEPFVSGMLESAAEPLGTTPTVVERVVLSACSTRVELDRGEQKVFKLDLAAPAPAADSQQVTELANTLYRRFHARDPEPAERTAIAELTVDAAGNAVAADEFAKLACFLVGTVSEFLFF
jgi:hypothetical protein